HVLPCAPLLVSLLSLLPLPRPPRSPLFPYTTLFRSPGAVPEPVVLVPTPAVHLAVGAFSAAVIDADGEVGEGHAGRRADLERQEDRKSTRLNSSHVKISYAVFCLKKKIHTI